MKFELKYKKEVYDCEWSDKTNFESLNPLLQASGFIFDEKGRICLIKVTDKQGWCLPGGGIEKYDKAPEDTFIREVDEEADLDLKNIQRLGYWKTTPRNRKQDIHYSARFVALIKKKKVQTLDPAFNIVPERIFINPKDFDKYTGWGTNGAYQLKKALEKINKLF